MCFSLSGKVPMGQTKQQTQAGDLHGSVCGLCLFVELKNWSACAVHFRRLIGPYTATPESIPLKASHFYWSIVWVPQEQSEIHNLLK